MSRLIKLKYVKCSIKIKLEVLDYYDYSDSVSNFMFILFVLFF